MLDESGRLCFRCPGQSLPVVPLTPSLSGGLKPYRRAGESRWARTFTGGRLDGPNCVAFDSSGNVYVASALTDNVIKFDRTEKLVTTFTGGGLNSPMGIARDTDDVLYVAGGLSHNIVRFDTEGSYLGELSHPDLATPQGVAFDGQGHLYSSSFSNDSVVEFDASGAYVRTITEGGLSVARSVAFVPVPEPRSATLLAIGLLSVVCWHRKARKALLANAA